MSGTVVVHLPNGTTYLRAKPSNARKRDEHGLGAGQQPQVRHQQLHDLERVIVGHPLRLRVPVTAQSVAGPMPECPRCGEPLTRDPQALAGGVGRADWSVLTCGDCGERYLERPDGTLEPYRWARNQLGARRAEAVLEPRRGRLCGQPVAKVLDGALQSLC